MKIHVTLLVATALSAPAHGQLRITEWNITDYASGRVTEFGTSIYGVNPGNGLSMTPDVMIVQEMISSTGVTNFLSILNNASGSPGDWAAAPFVNGPDTDNAFFYRTTKVVLFDVTIVSTGGPAPNHPRHVLRYDIHPVGYDDDSAVLACYSSHMKSGSGADDQARRLVEAQAIRGDAETLAEPWKFLLAGDFNIQSWNQAAYQELTAFQGNNDGRFFDPIATPGSWNNNEAFHFVHTQDPAGAGGMDDRHDQILVSADLIDDIGLDYLGNAAIPYSTTTWNDPNHTYRSWGNDGTSYNLTLTTIGNSMVGPTIAINLINAADGQGHLPVFMDVVVPAVPECGVDLDFGQVEQGSVAEMSMSVTNAGDTALWNAQGIADLQYSLTGLLGVSVDPGPYVEPAGGGGNLHTVTLDTSAPGPVLSAVEVYTLDGTSQPRCVVAVQGEVVLACPADVDGDGVVDVDDFLDVLAAWGPCPGCPEDLDGDGSVGVDEFLAVLAAWGPC